MAGALRVSLAPRPPQVRRMSIRTRFGVHPPARPASQWPGAERAPVMTTTTTDIPLRAAPASRAGHVVARALPWVVLAAAGAYTVAILVEPRAMTSWYSPDARVLIEALSLAVALFAALALALPADDIDRSRNAFIAGLLALAASYAVIVVGFILVISPSGAGRVVGVYAWLVARYLAGLFFIMAAIGRPRLGVWQFVAVIAATMALTVAVCGTLREFLPMPTTESAHGLAVVTFSAMEHAIISLVPAALFAVGSVLAWRVYRRQRRHIYAWLAFALAVQTLSKIHEAAYTTAFGPAITSADILRIAMLVLLLAGAAMTVRDVAADRTAAMEAQQRDLAALETMYAGLSRFAEKEQVFRAVVVHDLATPIAAIRAFAHVLANADGAAERAAAAEGIAQSSRRLQELIDRTEELRDIEKDNFSVDLRPMAVRPIVDDTAAFLRVLPGGHRIVVECDDLKAMADPVRLGQALRNLGTNAVRYSPEGSVIVLTCRAVGDRVQLAVVDSGPGMSPAERRRLIEKYQRGSHTSEAPGAGLGLYIAERISKAHGGRLVLADAPEGTGTSAIIELRRPR